MSYYQLMPFQTLFGLHLVYLGATAAKILANLIVMGGGILARALVQAYRQALQNASKTGVAQETLQNAVRKGSKAMTEQEARQILGFLSMWSDYPKIGIFESWSGLKKYDTLFERNAKNGSFYLQSKVHRAKECLETVYQEKDKPGDNAG
ncbi:protein Transporter, Pam16 [Artemisia annua]|uniref:Protein Transporter, Pam16 n=1 Tax=Artemisia annua TaxID=35608 RepID=A0A2U1NFZ1_ARTAN|nr:protein Transporter, Pam16 [Artemisia annua]